jgi:hypothetical protein
MQISFHSERAALSPRLRKHDTTPTRRDAGVAADSVILLANVLRRLRSPKRAATALKRLAVRKGPSQWPGPGVGEGPPGECVHLKELAAGHRCCTYGCTGRKVQQPSKGKPTLTRGGAKGTRTPNPLLAKWRHGSR